VTFSVDGVAWLSGAYLTVATDPIASLVPGAAGPEPEVDFADVGAFDDAGVDAADPVDAAGAGAAELDEELLPPQAANPAARPAVASTIPAPLLKPNQLV
jgi:hypothetical protein